MYKMRRKIRTKRVLRRKGQFHAVLWLVGLAVLAITGRWWPGILILVVISILLETAVKRGDHSDGAEEAPETVMEEKPEVTPSPISRVETVAPAPEVHKTEWLPLNCPKCGAPTRAADIRWTGDSSAACPYCGSNLPLKKA
jgi:DNA-directed RNA polymerase subunit RPC12/RpoP